MRILFSIITFLFLCISSSVASAATIEFPKEELAKESVLPVFDGKIKAVMSRRVINDQKIELGFGAGFIFNEPFFESMAFRFHGGYHFNSFSSLHASFFMRDGGQSADATEIDSKPSTKIGFGAVPIPEYMFTLDYQITPYYGKISLTKNGVMNMSLYGTAGVGAIDLGGVTTALANVGAGANLYITSRISLKTDMRFVMYNGLNVLSQASATKVATQPVEPGEFDEEFQVSPTISLGLSILL